MNIEGWIPTPLEKQLMDGSFDKEVDNEVIPVIDEDLLDIMEFNEAMNQLKKDLADSFIETDHVQREQSNS